MHGFYILNSCKTVRECLSPWLFRFDIPSEWMTRHYVAGSSWKRREKYICSAHCNCTAGLGQTCTHVAAILFTCMETAARIQGKETTTQHKYEWIMPSFRKNGQYTFPLRILILPLLLRWTSTRNNASLWKWGLSNWMVSHGLFADKYCA